MGKKSTDGTDTAVQGDHFHNLNKCLTLISAGQQFLLGPIRQKIKMLKDDLFPLFKVGENSLFDPMGYYVLTLPILFYCQ